MFHRSYDISCILDNSLRTHVQNAINGVNKACTDTVDAWIYVEQGYIMNDLNRTLHYNDHIPRTVFGEMAAAQPSVTSISYAITTLISIAQGYLTWQLQCQQETSRNEEISRFWASWKVNRLYPYYNASSGGGSRAGIIPILEEFYSLRSSRNDGISDELQVLEGQLLSSLGSTINERINVLEQIPLESYCYCKPLLQNYKKRITQTLDQVEHNGTQITAAMSHLRVAMESRNPLAISAALNPEWYSVDYHNSDLYKEAEALLTQISQ